jgi:hypothetical protein
LRSGKKLPTVIIPTKFNIFVPEAVAKLLEQSNSEPKFVDLNPAVANTRANFYKTFWNKFIFFVSNAIQ